MLQNFVVSRFFFLLLKEAVVDSKEEPHSVSPLAFPPPLVGSSFSLLLQATPLNSSITFLAISYGPANLISDSKISETDLAFESTFIVDFGVHRC